MIRAFSEKYFPARKADEDERRLFFASLPVLFLSALFLSDLFSPALLRLFVMENPGRALEAQVQASRIYPVLVEQKDKVDENRDEIKAYSDVESAGRGGVTTNYGFHTLTNFDRLTLSGGKNASMTQDTAEKWKEITQGEGPTTEIMKKSMSGSEGPGGSEDAYRIPANYRFRQDFAMRYDQSGPLSLARTELAGFRYFQNMLREIRYNFSPPGLNAVYRDSAGLVVSQPIKPQSVKVLFLLDSAGTVRDVRVVSSMGQKAVDQSCISVLSGRNFGTPPPEIFSQGNIFGINFIFPAVY